MDTIHDPPRRVKLEPGMRVRVRWSRKLGTIIATQHPNPDTRPTRNAAVVQLDPVLVTTTAGHQNLTPIQGIYLQADLEVVYE